MTTPRNILPGRYWFLSRRCTQQQFLLRPDRLTNDAFMYCLAEAAARFNIGVLAVTTMSNHYHAVLHDCDGRLPEFIAHFHKMVAKVLNRRWGREENLWASRSTSCLRCDTAEELMNAIAYTLTNPIKSQLVDAVRHWPGVNSYKDQLGGKRRTYSRPSHYFAKQGRMPDSASLQFSIPEIIQGYGLQEWRDWLRMIVTTAERRAADHRQEHGMRVLGRKTILRQSPFDSPRQTRARRIESAQRSTHRRARLRDSLFLQRYAEAWAQLKEGVRDVVFPAGTYLLRLRRLVRCEPLPPH